MNCCEFRYLSTRATRRIEDAEAKLYCVNSKVCGQHQVPIDLLSVKYERIFVCSPVL